MENVTRFLKRAFNIREGRAPYHVIRKRFVNGARLTGSHLCILIIAMLIASIGLDIDSDIAIVGAMLICPLMGSVPCHGIRHRHARPRDYRRGNCRPRAADGPLPDHVHAVF